jgi:hypothetical protein
MKKALLILSLLLVRTCQTPIYAQSKSIPLNVVSIDNSYMRPNVRIRAVRQAIEYYRKYGARISRRSVVRKEDPFFDVRDVNGSFLSFNMEFYSWFKTLQGDGELYKGVATHVLAPPWTVGGLRYMGGFAFMRKLFSYSTAQEYNTTGKYRFRHTVVGIVHELGHSIFGCEHKLGSNVMNLNAFSEQELIEGTGKLLPLGPECQKKVKKFT